MKCNALIRTRFYFKHLKILTEVNETGNVHEILSSMRDKAPASG